ncbi:exported hypothetical protein [Candidatus Sulfopaludibacter sp. SbA4]|nr:exported hypothetical protein [Candidatus Sulfopaludibacter sp. SbA4]
MRPPLFLALCALAGSFAVRAQPPAPTYISQTKFNTGQDVVPVYEGWLRNSDGTFTFVFGYFNRNWKEELVIPTGADNKLEPGPADRGQPTYFLPRRQSWVFRVQVPADWGNKELVWTLTAHGRSEKAYATLTPEEELSERIIMTGGSLNPGEDDPNKPPVITIDSIPAATAGRPVSLTAQVVDDGLPKPRIAPQARPEAFPTAQSNRTTASGPRGLTVTWFEYRGPAQVIFDPVGPIPVVEGKASTTARFAEAGTYTLRATANDGALSTSVNIVVTVISGSSK